MNNPLSLQDVLAATREILSQLLIVNLDEITPDSRIIEDLSADSLDIVDLSFQLGKRYGCTLPKMNVLDHAVEVCGNSRAFVSPTGLTEEGQGLLQSSLSAYTPDQFRPGMRPADVFAVTTVRNWAQQCFNLFDYLPTECPDCGGSHAQINEREQVVCASCQVRLVPADGDSVSRRLVEAYIETNMAISA